MSFYLLMYLPALLIIAANAKISLENFMGGNLVKSSQFIRIPQSENRFHTLNFVYSKDQPYCVSVYNLFIKAPLVAVLAVELSSSPPPKVLVDFQTTETLLLIDSLASFHDTFDRFVTSEYFQNSGKYKLLLCKEIATDVELLRGLVHLVWKYRMLDFVLIYFDQTVVNQVQYNPFTDELKVVNIDDVGEYHEEYPDKLKNMNGYPMKVLDFPHYIKSNICSFPCHFQESLETSMNASLIFKYLNIDESYTHNIMRHVSFSDIDVCLRPQAVSKRNVPEMYADKVEFTYPHMIDNIILAVPKPTKFKKWTLIFFSYNITVFGVILLLSALMAYLNKTLSLTSALNRLELNFFVSSLFRVPVQGIANNKTVLKAAWLLFSLFTSMLFDSLYLKKLLTDKFNSEIKTIEDLKKSGLPVYACRLQNLDPVKLNLSFSYTVLPRTEWEKLILKNDGMYAFLGTYTDVNFVAKYFASLHIDFKYQSLNQPILPKLASLIVRRKSPYIQKLSALAAKIMEFGITKKTYNTFKSITVSDVRMTFNHFLGVFFILACGLLLATAVFVFEILNGFIFSGFMDGLFQPNVRIN